MDDFLVILLIAVVWIFQAVGSARRRSAGRLGEGGADEPAPEAEQRRRAAEEARRRAEERALRWRRQEAAQGEGGRLAAEPEPEPLSLEVTPRRARTPPSRPSTSVDPARPRVGPPRITGRVRRREGRDRSSLPTPAPPSGAGRRTGALRRAVLWSEILAAPRALRPYDGEPDPS